MRATKLSIGLAFVATFDQVGLALGVEVGPPHYDGVESTVELAVAAAVESVTHRLTGRGWDRCVSLI